MVIRPRITSYHEMRKAAPWLGPGQGRGRRETLERGDIGSPPKKRCFTDGNKEGEGFDSFPLHRLLCSALTLRVLYLMYERRSRADSSPCAVGQLLGRQRVG